MPKMAGRGVFFAALAVPFAMAVAPLSATAEVPDDTVSTESLMAAGMATEDAAAAMASSPTTIVDKSDEEVFAPGPDWYGEDTETAAVAVLPTHEVSRGYGYGHSDPDWTAASYSDVTAAAGPDGAWVDSTESAAFTGDDGYGHSHGDVTAASYEEVEAAAGSEGAYVESVESAAVEYDGHGWHHNHGHGWHHDRWDGNDMTGAYHEEVVAAAGSDGAYVETVESAAVEYDGHGSHHGGWDDDEVTGAYHEELVAAAGADGAWVNSVESAAGELD